MLRTISNGFLGGAVVSFALAGCGDDGGSGGTTSVGTDSATTTTNGTMSSTTSVGSTSGSGSSSVTTTATTTTNGTTTATTGAGPVDAFRFSSIAVRDPHFYVDATLVGCIDATDMIPLNIAPSINQQFNDAMNMDVDGPNMDMMPDGNLDLSFLLLFRPLDMSGGGDVDFTKGDCIVPPELTQCTPEVMGNVTNATYTSMDTECLAADPAVLTDMYSPETNVVAGSCFLADAPSMTLELGGFEIPLSDVQIAATYSGTDDLISGLMVGFLSEADADANIIPADIDMVGGMPLSAIIPGGSGCCAAHSDLDDNNGTSGWYLHIDFEAYRVPYTE